MRGFELSSYVRLPPPSSILPPPSGTLASFQTQTAAASFRAVLSASFKVSSKLTFLRTPQCKLSPLDFTPSLTLTIFLGICLLDSLSQLLLNSDEPYAVGFGAHPQLPRDNGQRFDGTFSNVPRRRQHFFNGTIFRRLDSNIRIY